MEIFALVSGSSPFLYHQTQHGMTTYHQKAENGRYVRSEYDEMDKNVFYYSKDNSTMEVDFVVQGNRRVIPTEAKAEDNMHTKSLRLFITEDFKQFNLKGLRISMLPFKEQEWMTNIPLYSAEAFFKNEGLGTDD